MIKRSLSARQVKAARALLDWSQKDLAYAARLSVATVRKLELGHISPHEQTTRLIYQAVEDAGLEFIDSDGVRRKLEDISVFCGIDGTDQFLNDIGETTRSAGGELLIVASSLDELENVCGKGECPKLDGLLKKDAALSIKCLLMEVREPQLSTPHMQFRTISKQYVDSVSFYVYGDKYAVIPTDKDSCPKITVVKSTSVAESFRRQFFSLWEKATLGYVLSEEPQGIKRKSKI
ncbi:MAG: hypothetical protein RBT70_04740 [Alphaproteobacteria bacterium]|jgi:transcriptional regulator with XRE-family HTH domain|nr:hypothetical protein [Alphaproteobacteria bacterium]